VAHDIWSIVVLLGLAGWITAALGLIYTAFPKYGEFNSRCARTWGIALLCFYGVWIAGMLNA